MECKSCLAIDWSSFHLCQHWLKCKHVLYNIGVTIYVSMNHNFEDPLTNKLSIYEQSHSWVTTAFSTLNSAIHLGTTSIRSILCVGPSSSIVSSFSSGQHDSEPWAHGPWPLRTCCDDFGNLGAPQFSTVQYPPARHGIGDPATHHAMDLRENLQEIWETCVLVLK